MEAFSSYVLRILATTLIFVGCIAAQSGSETEAKLLSSEEFVLSESAKAAGIRGTVRLRLNVSKEGKARNVSILGGPAWPCGSKPNGIDEVREAIKETIRGATFSPAAKKGEPVESDLVLTLQVGIPPRELRSNDAGSGGQPGSPPKSISGGVLNGKVIRFPAPVYPDAARSSRLSGAVSVYIMFDEQGDVVLAGAISGHPLLQEAARDAACKAKFAPVQLSGFPVSVNGVLTYNFVP